MSSSTNRPFNLDPYDTTLTGPRGTAGATAVTTTTESTSDVAKDQAADVASDAAASGKHVAGVAKDQAADVVGQAGRQAKDLLGQTRSQLSEQTGAGQQRAASGLSALAAELKDLADGNGGNGIATDLAHQASQRVGSIGTWLEEREPADLLREVNDFARRRPVAFLALAAGAGLLAGRLTRGLTAAAHDAHDADGAADRASTLGTAQGTARTGYQGTSEVYGGGPTTGLDSTYPAASGQSWDGPGR